MILSPERSRKLSPSPQVSRREQIHLYSELTFLRSVFATPATASLKIQSNAWEEKEEMLSLS